MKPAVAAVIFDLDGTLIASLEDLADAVNAALTRHSLPTHPYEPYRYFVGNGMRKLVRRAVPESASEETVDAVFAASREEYAKGWARKTQPYPGINAMLENLAAMRIAVAVLTNKPHDFAVEMTAHFFPRTQFSVVQGFPGSGSPKPDPALAFAIAQKIGVSPEKTAFVGDSSVDMDTAVNAGMAPIGVLWGFRPESELVAHGAKVLLARPDALFEKVEFIK